MRDRCSIRFVLCFDFFPSTSEGRNVGAAASRKEKRSGGGEARNERKTEGERERRSHLESERYLHVICILVDPYCFHLQPIHRGDILMQSSLSYFPFSSYFCLPLSFFPSHPGLPDFQPYFQSFLCRPFCLLLSLNNPAKTCMLTITLSRR